MGIIFSHMGIIKSQCSIISCLMSIICCDTSAIICGRLIILSLIFIIHSAMLSIYCHLSHQTVSLGFYDQSTTWRPRPVPKDRFAISFCQTFWKIGWSDVDQVREFALVKFEPFFLHWSCSPSTGYVAGIRDKHSCFTSLKLNVWKSWCFPK